ncbi:MAG: SpoIID/LytB domain-containing protein [Lachnospiraceae bacterium]|nr:SpoIID/LytB domain-containing protein [Lachnospiraceae bacterium]
MSFGKKIILSILILILLFALALIPIFRFAKQQPEGVRISHRETGLLIETLGRLQDDEKGAILDALAQEINKQREGDLTYAEFLSIVRILEEGGLITREDEAFPIALTESLEEIYKNEFFLLKEHWYSFFDSVCGMLDPAGRIRTIEYLVLGNTSNVKTQSGDPLEEEAVFTSEGTVKTSLTLPEACYYTKASYVVCEERIIGWREISEEGAVLSNTWIMEAGGDHVMVFFANHEITLPCALQEEMRETVADLIFRNGSLEEIKRKDNRITGKVLKVGEKEIEIEGAGIFPLADEVQYYRLYDPLATVEKEEIRLGYSFSDFVVEDGTIQAGLLVKDETMETIRVLIKTSGFGGYFHEEIVLRSDVECEILSLSSGEGEVQSASIPAGESISFTVDSPYFIGNRIVIRPKALTGKLYLTNIERNHQGQGYRGCLELEKRQEGILAVNEVLLEEYLYAVVPSEMPSSYPEEALQAQAVCARTYAYDKMLHSSLADYGAHVDDSTSFQVYNNILENVNTTKAVKETRGELLYSPDGLAETYYYSTSGGFGTSDAIWNPQGNHVLPYLGAKEMTVSGESFSENGAVDLQQEEVFRSFMGTTHRHHFEAEEGWYRWTYETDGMEHIWENLKKRQEKDGAHILTKTEEGSFESGSTLPEEGVIRSMEVTRRGEGGSVEEILLTTDTGEILVQREMNVRALLADGTSPVRLQNGNTYDCKGLLPSAFFYLDPVTQEEKVTGYRLTGGGFGHGVGMSQNGAKHLANQGKSSDEILTFYFTGCWTEKVYE